MSRNGTSIETAITIERGNTDADGEHEPAVESEDVTVAWQFSRLDPGRYSGPPENCYPAEGGEVQSCTVTRADGSVIADGEDWLLREIGHDRYEAAAEDALQQSLDAAESTHEALQEDYDIWMAER